MVCMANLYFVMRCIVHQRSGFVCQLGVCSLCDNHGCSCLYDGSHLFFVGTAFKATFSCGKALDLFSSVQFWMVSYVLGQNPIDHCFYLFFSFFVWLQSFIPCLDCFETWGRAREVFSSGLYLMCSGKTPLTTAFISASFLQAFSGVMALALYPQVLSQKL